MICSNAVTIAMTVDPPISIIAILVVKGSITVILVVKTIPLFRVTNILHRKNYWFCVSYGSAPILRPILGVMH